VGKVRKSDLPAPFRSLQAANLDEFDDLRRLISESSKRLETNVSNIDLLSCTKDLIRLDVRAEERRRAIEDPFSSELSREVEAEMRAFDSGTVEALRLLVKYGELTERATGDKVRQSGKYTNTSMFLIGIDNRTGWLLKTQSSPYPNVSRDEDRYTLNPHMRPYLLSWFEKHR
jgi:hypothetical protein